MPRYYFHVSDGRCAPDEVGVELVDETAARREALRRAIMLVKATNGRSERYRRWRVDVIDKEGAVLFWIGANDGAIAPSN